MFPVQSNSYQPPAITIVQIEDSRIVALEKDMAHMRKKLASLEQDLKELDEEHYSSENYSSENYSSPSETEYYSD